MGASGPGRRGLGQAGPAGGDAEAYEVAGVAAAVLPDGPAAAEAVVVEVRVSVGVAQDAGPDEHALVLERDRPWVSGGGRGHGGADLAVAEDVLVAAAEGGLPLGSRFQAQLEVRLSRWVHE